MLFSYLLLIGWLHSYYNWFIYFLLELKTWYTAKDSLRRYEPDCHLEPLPKLMGHIQAIVLSQ